MWFFKKKPIAAVCFEIQDILVSAPLGAYKTFASNAYGCTEDQIETAVTNHWVELELGKSTPEEFWDQVGADLIDMGVKHKVPGWKFKGIWDGVVSDSISIDKEVTGLVQQIRAKKIRTVATSNLTAEITLAFQRLQVFEPFNLAVLSSQINARKPDPEVFKRMSKLARTPPAQCLYVDKDPVNLEAAKTAGYKVLTFENAADTRWELLHLGLLT